LPYIKSLGEFRHQSLRRARQVFINTLVDKDQTIARLRQNRDSFLLVIGADREPLWDVQPISDELGTMLHRCSSPGTVLGISVLRKKAVYIEALLHQELACGSGIAAAAIPEGWVVAEATSSNSSSSERVNIPSKLSSFERFFAPVGSGRMMPRKDAPLVALPQDLESALIRINNRAARVNKVDRVTYETLRLLGTYPFFVLIGQAAVALKETADHSLSVDLVSHRNLGDLEQSLLGRARGGFETSNAEDESDWSELKRLLRIVLAQSGHFLNKILCLARHGYCGYEWAEMAIHYYLVRLLQQMFVICLPGSSSYRNRILQRLLRYEATLRKIASREFSSDHDYFLIEPCDLRSFALALIKVVEVMRNVACTPVGEFPDLHLMDDPTVGGLLSMHYGELTDSVIFAVRHNREYSYQITPRLKELVAALDPLTES